MGVPVAVDAAGVRRRARHNLDEADAAFDKAAGAQQVRSIGFGGVVVEAIGLLGSVGLLGEVDGFRRGFLHAIGEFVGARTGQQFGVFRTQGRAVLVERLQQVELLALLRIGDEFGMVEIDDRRIAGTEGSALVDGRQEAGAPVDRSAGWFAISVIKHDIGRQVGIGRTQRIGDPGAERGTARLHVAGVEFQDGNVVRRADGFAVLDEAELVGVLGDVRHEVGEPGAALAILLPGAVRGEQLADAALGGRLDALQEGRGDFLSGEADQFGLVVKEIERARRAVHMQPDHRFGLGGEMGILGGQGIGELGRAGGENAASRHHRAQGESANSHGCPEQHLASGLIGHGFSPFSRI